MVAMRDKGRKWMWGFLAAGILFQFYFVWEYLTVFALFAVGFLALTLLVATAFSIQKGWEIGVAKILASQSPAVLTSRRAIAAVEELALRPFRRPV
jgi:hypothetical protein